MFILFIFFYRIYIDQVANLILLKKIIANHKLHNKDALTKKEKKTYKFECKFKSHIT